MPLRTVRIPSAYGLLHARISQPKTSSAHPTILLIHGNSSSSRIFTPMLTSSISQSHTLIAFDLPGHGASSDAPSSTLYTQPAYARAALAVVEHFVLTRVILLGWSLGGHVALEMVPLLGVRLRGLMIVGTPACGRGRAQEGFKIDVKGALAFKEVLNESEMDVLAGSAGRYDEFMGRDVRRTDGRARRVMYEEMCVGGQGVDQREVAEGKGPLLAVVNGRDEAFVDLEFVDSVKYGNLWKGKTMRLEGGHAPFWEKPQGFLEVWEEFVSDCEKA